MPADRSQQPRLLQHLFNSDYGDSAGLGDNDFAMPIPPAPTPEQFEQVAKAIDPGATVTSTQKLVGGLGCRMDVLEMHLGNGFAHKVVTRQYWETKDPGNNKRPRGESTVLNVLNSHGVPVPQPVLDEKTASKIFGRPGLVISYIDGKANLQPQDIGDWARQLAGVLAQIHSVPVPPELESVPRSHINSLNKWMAADEAPGRYAKHPLGTDLWNAMRALWPDVDTSANQITHSDFWPGNTLWKDQKLLAVVDWEWPSLGVPSDDVGYFLTDAVYAGFDVEETFLMAYESAAEKPVQDLLFWKMMAASIPLPDVGPWAQGYEELGIRKMNEDGIRAAHSNHIRNLLNEFNG
jgi:aminoglycoside phosphotransferase (APT) family kinase protein